MQLEILGLKALYHNQAQKEVIINQNFELLGRLVNTYVVSKSKVEPPIVPANGALYIIANEAQGEWLGKDSCLVYFDSMWRYITPIVGMIFYVLEERDFFLYKDNTWVSITSYSEK